MGRQDPRSGGFRGAGAIASVAIAGAVAALVFRGGAATPPPGTPSPPPAAVVARSVTTESATTVAETPAPVARLARSAPIATTPPPSAPPIRPETVMVIGDSGTYDMYPAFEQGFIAAGVRVISAAFPGEGLTTPAGIRRLWYEAAAREHVDFFVVSIGTWDDAFILTHGWTAYLNEVDDTVQTLTRSGAHILWLSMMPSDALLPDAHVKPLLQNRLFSALPSRYPGVVDYLDITATLTAPDGTTPRTMNGHLLRKPDGWHLCPDGAAAVAHAVLAHLGLDSTGWERGAWRRDPRYDDPPGGCPNSG